RSPLSCFVFRLSTKWILSDPTSRRLETHRSTPSRAGRLSKWNNFGTTAFRFTMPGTGGRSRSDALDATAVDNRRWRALGVLCIGAARIMPATLSMLTNIFPDAKERARAIGVWAAVAGGGSAIGPLLGGFLLRHFWWGSVFLVNVPVTIVAFVAGRFLLPPSRDPSAPRLDPLGAVLSVAGLIALLWAII